MYDNESLHSDSAHESARPEGMNEAPNAPVQEPVNGTPTPQDQSPPTSARHAQAGRKGAQRIHQLIEEGKLYEQEHGLKRGRQRLRQLIEEGRLYEEEHGGQLRRKRKARLSSDELIESFFQSLVRLVKPRFRPRLVQLMQRLEAESK